MPAPRRSPSTCASLQQPEQQSWEFRHLHAKATLTATTAAHVAEVGLRAAEDAQVAAVARGEGRAVVTENVVDFAAERDVVLVFVLKKNLPAGGGQAAALAKVLDRWAQERPSPYLGPHWPST
jgi:Domain of unknown function (DUF5615)